MLAVSMFSASPAIWWPRPEKDAIVSEPRIARKARISPIRNPVSTIGNAAGNNTDQNICREEAPMERAAVRYAESTRLSPEIVLSTMGKKAMVAPMAIFDPGPSPRKRT